MKKNILRSAAIILILFSVICIVSCNNMDLNELFNNNADHDQSTTLWENAIYDSDAAVGKGSKAFTCDIEAGDKKITISVKTDKDTLGAALYEYDLINDDSFFDTLNGIKADWNKDNAYWAFYVNGSYALKGVNDTKITGGEHFRFVYSK